jgi:hypothetical protein
MRVRPRREMQSKLSENPSVSNAKWCKSSSKGKLNVVRLLLLTTPLSEIPQRVHRVITLLQRDQFAMVMLWYEPAEEDSEGEEDREGMRLRIPDTPDLAAAAQ